MPERKFKRSRSSKRRKNENIFLSNRASKVRKAVFIIVLILLIPAGFFAAKFVKEGNFLVRKDGEPTTTSPKGGTITTNPLAPTNPSQTGDTTTTKDINTSENGYRAFYLPFSSLKNEGTLLNLLDDAKAAGFNAVVFDLKNTDGVLNYQSATEMVKKVSSATAADAITPAQLRALLTTISNKGFTPIPRVFAFKDSTAPHDLPSAKITLDSDGSTTWLDNSFDRGGKAWLNPYAPDAHKYIIEIAKEIKGLGADAIMVDGVQFPLQTYRINYGKDPLVNLSQTDVLRKFVSDLGTALGSDTDLILSFPGTAAVGENSTPYGGDPVSLGGDIVSPSLLLSSFTSPLKVGDKTINDAFANVKDTINTIAAYIGLRIDIMNEPKPNLMPWLQTEGLSSSQISNQIDALDALRHDNTAFIIYNESGSYNFAQLSAG